MVFYFLFFIFLFWLVVLIDLQDVFFGGFGKMLEINNQERLKK